MTLPLRNGIFDEQKLFVCIFGLPNIFVINGNRFKLFELYAENKRKNLTIFVCFNKT